MRFTQLLPHIQAAYPERGRTFHIIATRFYLGIESLEDLEAMTWEQPCYNDHCVKPILTFEEARTIVNNR